tara:strand:+ start:2971 stop:4608 length:1638 start_codon:yes stop_codon:yes gene_type:complete
MAKRRFSIGNFLRKKTPIPSDRAVFQMGIQERADSIFMTSPILYEVANSSVIVRTCTTQLKNEIFRRGYEWKKKFALKCEECGKEHENLVEECSECNSINLKKPDQKQLEYINGMFNSYINSSEQLFVDVLKQLEDDLNILDDAYIILVKEYFVDGNGEIKLHKVKEIYRGDPVTMTIYADEYGERGVKGFTALHDRDIISDDAHECHPDSGEILHPVHYVNRVNGEEQYFIKGEVLHFSKYSPSRLYGQSPIMTLFKHITTLLAMENYVNTAYTKSRMPRGLLAVQTRNMESMRTFWRAVKEKMEEDKHFIPVMGIEADNGKGSVEWIKFMDSLKEMDYIQVKEDLRDRVAAFFGVSKIFMADSSTSGGLNNEGMQILVTNRAVEMGQNVYNKYVFPWLCNELGVTDWKLVLPPSEEEDEIAVLRKRELEVGIANSIKGLGFEVEMSEDGEFVFKKPLPEEMPKPEGEQEKVEPDPFAGRDMDAGQMAELQEQQFTGANNPPAEGGQTTRNKPSMSVAPPNRNTGLPHEAANNNVDKRTERRVG